MTHFCLVQDLLAGAEDHLLLYCLSTVEYDFKGKQLAGLMWQNPFIHIKYQYLISYLCIQVSWIGKKKTILVEYTTTYVDYCSNFICWPPIYSLVMTQLHR